MQTFTALAAPRPGAPLQRVSLPAEPPGPHEVEVAVEACGLCHSDLEVLGDAWRNTVFPVVPGHEIVGRISRVGAAVPALSAGQRVGVGWACGSCMACDCCLDGRHNLCPDLRQTIIGRHGGLAELVRCHWAWAVPLDDAIDPTEAAPLLCAGSTVFHALEALKVPPTAHVGVLGIGGLGHLALQVARAWGCEVTALTSSPSKVAEARALGAHRVVLSGDRTQTDGIRRQLDLLLVTSSGPVDWRGALRTLAPGGRVHLVGAPADPLPVHALQLINGQRSVSGSPVGGPATNRRMLRFFARHDIRPRVEVFPMSKANEALAHLRAGRPRYRVVLTNDLG